MMYGAQRGLNRHVTIGVILLCARSQLVSQTGTVGAMESDVREALRHLTTAFENHLEAVIERRGPVDAAVDDAYETLAEAFERYEDLLDSEFAEDLPLVVDDEGDDSDASATLDEEELDESEYSDGGDMLANGTAESEIEDLDEFDLRD